jgi:hypothetical protein
MDNMWIIVNLLLFMGFVLLVGCVLILRAEFKLTKTKLSRLEDIVMSIERKTSLYIPKYDGGWGVPQYLGYTRDYPDFIGVGTILNMILKKLGMTIKRIAPPAEDAILIETKPPIRK